MYMPCEPMITGHGTVYPIIPLMLSLSKHRTS